MVDKTAQTSSLMEYLPGIYREDPTLGRFLLAFEEILLAHRDTHADPTNQKELQGLEEIIAGISNLFDPNKVPEEFLPWLAGWVAFTLWADVDVEKQRDFIANMTKLYRWRGTKNNLRQLLDIFTGGKTSFPDLSDNEEPHYFKVSLDLSELVSVDATEEERQAKLKRQIEIAYALIHLEKPAHTRYTLQLIFPSFRIGSQAKGTKFHTRVGKNTRLGAKNVPRLEKM